MEEQYKLTRPLSHSKLIQIEVKTDSMKKVRMSKRHHSNGRKQISNTLAHPGDTQLPVLRYHAAAAEPGSSGGGKPRNSSMRRVSLKCFGADIRSTSDKGFSFDNAARSLPNPF